MEKQLSTAQERPLMGKWGKRLYLLSLFMLVFTGFGQMPIFKRYYLADIPGLAWTADFYVTLYIHYVAAIVFVFLCVYYLMGYLKKGLPRGALLGRYVVRTLFIGLALISGFVLAARNMTAVDISPGAAYIVVWMHFISSMLFLIAAATYLRKKVAPARSGRSNS
jgi:hypothetical protein